MAFMPFLAMTAAELGNFSDLPPRIAWMACHFSPYGLGVSNLPRRLPPGSIIILDDITPIRRHDPEMISRQLLELVTELSCYGILLDFQRPDSPEAAALALHLSEALPCPVIVSELYAPGMTCPVLLSATGPSVTLRDQIEPWTGREIWLEAGLTGELITLTERGCRREILSYPNTHQTGFHDPFLHCHYRIETNEKSARFTLWRTQDDLKQFLEEAHDLGVNDLIGLYQELKQIL